MERACERPRRLDAPLDQHGYELGWRQRLDLAGEWLARNDVHRLADEQVAHCAVLEHLCQEVPDLVHLAETLEHGREPTVLLSRLFRVGEIVVEVVLSRRRRHAKQLAAWRVDHDRAKSADF